MKETVNIQQTNFSICISSETLSYILAGAMAFSSIFYLCYYIILPNCIHSRYTHIKPNTTAHLSLARSVCALLNAFLCVILCLALDDPLNSQFQNAHIYSLTTAEQRRISFIYIGYFIYDTIICCIIFQIKVQKKPDYTYILHNLIGIICAGTCIPAVYSGYACMFGIFWMEITYPLLHIPTMMNILLRKNTLTMLVMKGLYIMFSAITRLVICGYASFQLVTTYSEVFIMYKLNAIAFMVAIAVTFPRTVHNYQQICRLYIFQAQAAKIKGNDKETKQLIY